MELGYLKGFLWGLSLQSNRFIYDYKHKQD